MSTWPLEGTTPLIADRYINTYIAGEDLLTVGMLVEITADNTVKKPTLANSKKIAGVTLTKAASGAKISVVSRGIVRVVPNASISAGDQVAAYSAGTAVTDNSSKDTSIIGVCTQGGTSAGTAIIELW